LAALTLLWACSHEVQAEGFWSSKPGAVKIGFIGSLSNFAAAYGQAVLDGARLAVEEINGTGASALQLIVEDDGSETRKTVTAYQKLVTADKVDALVAGSWWADSLPPFLKKDRMVLLSCETVFDKGTIPAETYFIMLGDLRDWVRVFEPLIEKKGWKTGAVLRFTSGFAQTIAEEMKKVFSKDGRRLLADFEYATFDARDSFPALLKLGRLRPQVLYVDAQPQSFSVILRRLEELRLNEITVLTNAIGRDVIQQKLIDASRVQEYYFSQRQILGTGFPQHFRRRYGKEPELNSDLGYLAVYLIYQAFQSNDPLQAIKRGDLEVDGVKLAFDQRNVLTGIKHQVYAVKKGKVELLY